MDSLSFLQRKSEYPNEQTNDPCGRTSMDSDVANH